MQELDRKDVEAAKMQEDIRRRNMGAAVPIKAPKKPRKNNTIKCAAASAIDVVGSTSTAVDTGNCLF